MHRTVFLLVLLLCGCRQQATPLSNPFLAPSRVPPPATRTPAPGTAIPYYGGANSPGMTTPITSASDPAGIKVPSDEQSERLLLQASFEDKTAAARSARRTGRSPELGDLPLAPDNARREDETDDRALAARDGFRPRNGQSPRDANVQVAAFELELSSREAVDAIDSRSVDNDSAAAWSRYGHAANYSWLQGKLEHTQATDQWKLRYIPVDGQTDPYGGSVVLENPTRLGELAAGDFIRVEGALVAEKTDKLSYAPFYRLRSAEPIPD